MEYGNGPSGSVQVQSVASVLPVSRKVHIQCTLSGSGTFSVVDGNGVSKMSQSTTGVTGGLYASDIYAKLVASVGTLPVASAANIVDNGDGTVDVTLLPGTAYNSYVFASDDGAVVVTYPIAGVAGTGRYGVAGKYGDRVLDTDGNEYKLINAANYADPSGWLLVPKSLIAQDIAAGMNF